MPIWDSPLTPKEYWAKQHVLDRWVPIICWIDDRGCSRIAEWLRVRTISNLPYG